MRCWTLLVLLMLPANWLQAGDLEDLQGYWISLDDPWSVEIHDDVAIFRGEHAFHRLRNQDVKLRFTLDSEAKPRRINLNADDFQAANKSSKISDYDRRAGVYRLIRDELTLQFWSANFRDKDFDYWEGAPANHARPMSRRLRRVSPTELRALQKLAGVWKAEILDGKRTIFADSFFLQPGWLLSTKLGPCRMQLLPVTDQASEQIPLLVHYHSQILERNFFGGSFTTHHWLAGIGHLQPEGDRQLSGQLSWLYREKQLDNAAFQTLAALDMDDVAKIRKQGSQSAQLPAQVQMKLTKTADQIEFQHGHIPNLHLLPTDEHLTGEWQAIMSGTRKELADDKSTLEFAVEPRPERWKFKPGNCEIRSGVKIETRALTRRSSVGNFVDVALPDTPNQFLGHWKMRYEPQAGLLHVIRHERLDDIPIYGEYVLERVPASNGQTPTKP